MALVLSPLSCPSISASSPRRSGKLWSGFNATVNSPVRTLICRSPQCLAASSPSPPVCFRERLSFDRNSIDFGEFKSEEELWAAVRLRIRTFYEFNQSIGLEDHRKSLAQREFEALKERIAGETNGFRKVSCVNATLPLFSMPLAACHDLNSVCKFSRNGEERVVVGTLDVNQCLRMADELTGKKPEGIGADITRAYLSNVCVAEELQRNGVAYALINEAKKLAHSWGISDLYVHVAVDNEAAKKLYEKCGFNYENEEQTWQARFLGRPRRYLLWTDVTQISGFPLRSCLDESLEKFKVTRHRNQIGEETGQMQL